MDDIDSRISKAKEKLAQLEARRELLENRKLQRLVKGQRADDTRRKILIGSMVLSQMAANEKLHGQVVAGLGEFLTRDTDRQLFGLPPSRGKGEAQA